MLHVSRPLSCGCHRPQTTALARSLALTRTTTIARTFNLSQTFTLSQVIILSRGLNTRATNVLKCEPGRNIKLERQCMIPDSKTLSCDNNTLARQSLQYEKKRTLELGRKGTILDSRVTNGVDIALRHMSTSGKPPDWPPDNPYDKKNKPDRTADDLRNDEMGKWPKYDPKTKPDNSTYNSDMMEKWPGFDGKNKFDATTDPYSNGRMANQTGYYPGTKTDSAYDTPTYNRMENKISYNQRKEIDGASATPMNENMEKWPSYDQKSDNNTNSTPMNENMDKRPSYDQKSGINNSNSTPTNVNMEKWPSYNPESKTNSTTINTSSRMEKWLSYVQEKSPEIYSLGQKLSVKSSSLMSSIGSNKAAGDKKPEDWNDILNRWYQQYQDFVGITDLKKAQDKVTELSETLLEAQGRRRELQAELEDLQEKLRINQQRITKTEQYSHEHFALFDQAREMNDRLKVVRAEFSQCERTERGSFTQLSAAIRDCHERERMQAEQSKYWSIIASVVSAALASLITSVNNWVRIREIKDHVSSTNKYLLDGYHQMQHDVLGAIAGATGASGSLNVTATQTDTQKNLSVASQGAANSKSTDAQKALAVAGAIKSDIGASEQHGKPMESKAVVPGSDAEAAKAFMGPVTATIPPEEVSRISQDLYQSLWGEISGALGKEREKLKEQVAEQIKTVLSQVSVEGDRAREELGVLGKAMTDLSNREAERLEAKAAADLTLETAQALGSAIVQDSIIADIPAKATGSDYSYRHIASAMAVGAGLGTLATAFILKSLAGG